jgi:hypothetical protein
MQEPVYVIMIRNKIKKVIAYSIVSEKDYDKVNKHRWYLTPKGYAQSSSVGRMNRFIMNAKKGDPKVDHKNNNKLDNTESNLRFATDPQNNQNRLKKEGCTSKYIGVSYAKKANKWISQIYNNRIVLRQTFKKELHAAYWYDIHAIKLYGSDAKLNGVEKPIDFVEPIIKEKKENLPKNITKKRKKYLVRININKQIYTGIYQTLHEAKQNLDKIKKQAEKERIEEIYNREIIRNNDGFAIIKTYNEDEAIVDDNKYYTLIQQTWSINKEGYVVTSNIRMHRLVMEAKKDDPLVDHINGNKLDNRICNLRFSSDGPNNHNKKKRKNASSQYFGVIKNYKKYKAQIQKDGIKYRMGTFVNEIEAAKAYDKKALELYGTFANLNFPNNE